MGSLSGGGGRALAFGVSVTAPDGEDKVAAFLDLLRLKDPFAARI